MISNNALEILRAIISSHTQGVHKNRIKSLFNYFQMDSDVIDESIDYLKNIGEIERLDDRYYPVSTRTVDFKGISIVLSSLPTDALSAQFTLIPSKGRGRLSLNDRTEFLSQNYDDWFQIPPDQNKWFQNKVKFFEENFSEGELTLDKLTYFCPWKGNSNYFKYSQLSNNDKGKSLLYRHQYDGFNQYGWIKFDDKSYKSFSISPGSVDIVRFMWRINSNYAPNKNRVVFQNIEEGFLIKNNFFPEKERLLFSLFGIINNIEDNHENETFTYIFEERYREIIQEIIDKLSK